MCNAELQLTGSLCDMGIYRSKNRKIVDAIEARKRYLHKFNYFVRDAVCKYVVSEGIGYMDTYGPLLTCEGNKATICVLYFKNR
jgi:hypothetical protein